MKLGTWQILPTGPTAFGDSPYQPLSTFAGNELLIDVLELCEYGLLKERELAPLRRLPARSVDFGKLIPLKTALLKEAARRFGDVANSAQKSRYAQFVEDNGANWLNDYALFRVLKAQHGERPWPEWDRAFRCRHKIAMRKLEKSAAADIELIKVIQFLFDEQWRSLRAYANAAGVSLFGDLPVYIALDSADAWANPGLLQIDREGRPNRVAGVPPDYFSKDGQLWGNPLYAWDKHAAEDYRWWISRLEASIRRTDLVRIDHFRAFASFWSVPAAAATARDGAWVPGPGDAVFDAARAALGQIPVVAEDLGMITPDVTELRERHGIPGMLVLQFKATEDDFDLSDVPAYCVCYTGTHDNDTTRGWYRTAATADRRRILELTGGKVKTVHHDMIRLAFGSDARLVIAPLQDYLGLGSSARYNTPGTSKGNWRWRVRKTQLTETVYAEVAAMVSDAGRAA